MTLVNDAQERKNTPLYSGVRAYFPDALEAVARVSFAGNEQHSPGTLLHWDRSKSADEYDACDRHLNDRAKGKEFDTDGQRHMAKVAWRALAALQKEIEEAGYQEALKKLDKLGVENSKSQKIAPPHATRKNCTGDPACLTDSGRQAQWRDELVVEHRRQVDVIREQHNASAASIEGYIESLQSCGEEDCK